MVKLWYGDYFIGVFSLKEIEPLLEECCSYWYEWCEGYGP